MRARQCQCRFGRSLTTSRGSRWISADRASVELRPRCFSNGALLFSSLRISSSAGRRRSSPYEISLQHQQPWAAPNLLHKKEKQH